MGFRQANIYITKLSEILNIEEAILMDAISQSRTGGYARVWEINDEENYATCRLSTSRKVDKKNFVPDFQDGFIRFVGNAYEKIKDIEIPTNSKGDSIGIPIQITSCEATTFYSEKTKKTYHNYAVFAFDFIENDSNGDKKSKETTKKTAKSEKKTRSKSKKTKDEDASEQAESDEDLPF